MPDRYDIQARYIPAILCSVPFIALSFYFLGSIDTTLGKKILAVGFGGVTMSTALYELAAHSCRLVGKFIEEKMFKNGSDYPTTRFLLHQDQTYSPEHKKAIYQKILEFGVDLRRKASDTPANRRRINEAVGLVRGKFFGKPGLLMQRNIQYGFARNMTGGSIVAILTSAIAIGLSAYTHLSAALHISEILLVVYVIVAVAALAAMRFTSKYYAFALFDELLKK